MTRVKVTVRPSSDLRCAFCHGALGEEARPCRACFTALHDECWDDAGVCPTLGCATWMRVIRIFPRAVLASWWLLGWWLTLYAAVATGYVFVVPAFAQMYRETGLSLPTPTDTVVALGSFACSPLGVVVALAVPIVSVLVFMRNRVARWLCPALYTLIVLAVGLAISTIMALFLPTVQIGQKL